MRANLPVLAIIAVTLPASPPGAYAAGSTMWGSEHLLHLMDKDRNGVVSRREFANFMHRTFKRLDANRNGKLERDELRPLSHGTWDRR